MRIASQSGEREKGRRVKKLTPGLHHAVQTHYTFVSTSVIAAHHTLHFNCRLGPGPSLLGSYVTSRTSNVANCSSEL